jgi:hypothetical protein
VLYPRLDTVPEGRREQLAAMSRYVGGTPRVGGEAAGAGLAPAPAGSRGRARPGTGPSHDAGRGEDAGHLRRRRKDAKLASVTSHVRVSRGGGALGAVPAASGPLAQGSAAEPPLMTPRGATLRPSPPPSSHSVPVLPLAPPGADCAGSEEK